MNRIVCSSRDTLHVWKKLFRDARVHRLVQSKHFGVEDISKVTKLSIPEVADLMLGAQRMRWMVIGLGSLLLFVEERTFGLGKRLISILGSLEDLDSTYMHFQIHRKVKTHVPGLDWDRISSHHPRKNVLDEWAQSSVWQDDLNALADLGWSSRLAIPSFHQDIKADLMELFLRGKHATYFVLIGERGSGKTWLTLQALEEACKQNGFPAIHIPLHSAHNASHIVNTFAQATGLPINNSFLRDIRHALFGTGTQQQSPQQQLVFILDQVEHYARTVRKNNQRLLLVLDDINRLIEADMDVDNAVGKELLPVLLSRINQWAREDVCAVVLTCSDSYYFHDLQSRLQKENCVEYHYVGSVTEAEAEEFIKSECVHELTETELHFLSRYYSRLPQDIRRMVESLNNDRSIADGKVEETLLDWPRSMSTRDESQLQERPFWDQLCELYAQIGALIRRFYIREQGTHYQNVQRLMSSKVPADQMEMAACILDCLCEVDVDAGMPLTSVCATVSSRFPSLNRQAILDCIELLVKHNILVYGVYGRDAGANGVTSGPEHQSGKFPNSVSRTVMALWLDEYKHIARQNAQQYLSAVLQTFRGYKHVLVAILRAVETTGKDGEVDMDELVEMVVQQVGGTYAGRVNEAIDVLLSNRILQVSGFDGVTFYSQNVEEVVQSWLASRQRQIGWGRWFMQKLGLASSYRASS